MICYLVPDHDGPSWGIGLLYHHVRLLRELGFDACVVHRRAPFRVSWLEVSVPVRYLDDRSFRLRPADLLVVPEVLAHQPAVLSIRCRRIVFVQGSFLILTEAREIIDYPTLGYEAAIATLPHVQEIVATHYGITPVIVPPFVAQYFFVDPTTLVRPRDRCVLLAGKPEYRRAGYLDYEIVTTLLKRHLSRRGRQVQPGWDVVELAGRTHRQVAALMQQSAVLVNLNTLEAFNAMVPEAMAAGCVAVCYDAYGGRDYLDCGVNAFVFPNNHVYPLLETLLRLIDTDDAVSDRLAVMRRAALDTANRYREERTAAALAKVYRAWVS